MTIIATCRSSAHGLRLGVLCGALLIAFFEPGIGNSQLALAAAPVARFTCSAPGTTLVCSPCPAHCDAATSGFALTTRAVTLDGSASSSGTSGGSITQYRWSTGGTDFGMGAQLDHVFGAGTHDVTLAVTDNLGGGDTKHRTIAVNAPPVARFSRAPDRVLEPGEQVSFDGTPSTDPGGTTSAKTGIGAYAWTFPGSATTTEPKPSRTYAQPGTYLVRLTVTDKDGTTDLHEESLRVNAPPTPAFTITTLGAAAEPGEAVAFDASGSTDSDGRIASYAWDFGDGTMAADAQPSHAFATAGAHAVTLTVTDNDGKSRSSTTTVRVNQPPTASFTFQGSETGVPIAFDGRGSRDADGSIVTYRWDFGDGATAEGGERLHAFVRPGRYSVSLTVTDGDGATAGSSAIVEITDPPPPVFNPVSDSVGVVDSAHACGNSPDDRTDGCPRRLKVHIRGRWRVNRLYSKLMTLYVRAPTGSRISVRCAAKRGACPFSSRIVRKTTKATTGLTRYFGKTRILPAGTVITVRVTRAPVRSGATSDLPCAPGAGSRL